MFNLLKNILMSSLSLSNREFIQKHNSENHSYQVEANNFINHTYIDEFNNMNHNIFVSNDNPIIINFTDLNKNSIDWRERYKVSSVKNQGSCGSCWAFSSVGAVESAWAIKHNILYNLSEQELIDCSTQNNGCEGGSMDLAFQYIIENGLCSNLSYPYTAEDGQCEKDCKSLVQISNYSDIIPNQEKMLMRAVQHQPVSVAIQANKRSFQMYKSGIYSDPECGFKLDHGVLLVGYGYDKDYDMDYWIIKNSWSYSWGENGYIRIQRNIDDSRGLCGIAMDPSIPII
jgi:C1A family cysteine protease